MKHWEITLRHSSGRTKIIKVAGGLSEPEAVRNAILKAGNYWRLTEPAKLVTP